MNKQPTLLTRPSICFRGGDEMVRMAGRIMHRLFRDALDARKQYFYFSLDYEKRSLSITISRALLPASHNTLGEIVGHWMKAFNNRTSSVPAKDSSLRLTDRDQDSWNIEPYQIIKVYKELSANCYEPVVCKAAGQTPENADFFEQGAEYYITITKAS